MRRQHMIPVRISTPPDTTNRSVRVTVAATGKDLFLPVSDVDFLPGHVLVPDWLYRKMRQYLGAARHGADQ